VHITVEEDKVFELDSVVEGTRISEKITPPIGNRINPHHKSVRIYSRCSNAKIPSGFLLLFQRSVRKGEVPKCDDRLDPRRTEFACHRKIALVSGSILFFPARLDTLLLEAEAVLGHAQLFEYGKVKIKICP